MPIMTITTDQAMTVINLINDYLFKGGTGLDADHLEAVATALTEADQIIIEDAE